MKTYALFILALLLCGFSFGQSKGKLSFFSQDGNKFWVVINGQKINKDAQYAVNDIAVDFQWGKAKIIFEDPKIPSIDKNVQVVDADGHNCNVKYMIRKTDKGKYVIRDIDAAYEIIGSSNVSTTSTTGTQTTQQNQTVQTNQSTTPPTSQTSTQTYQQTTTTSNPNQQINMNVGMNVTETPTGVNVQMNVPGIQTTQGTVVSNQVTTTTTTTSTSTGKPMEQNQVTMQAKPVNPVPGYNGPTGCTIPMSDVDFQSAKNSISAKSFEDSKLTIAKQVTSANCLLCSQVKEIMKLFSFESTRLEYAKYAYKYTYDKGNYYKLNDAFQFESSTEELNEFINGDKE